MSSVTSYLKSSVGKKYLVAITGLGLGAFVLSHVAANMMIIFSAQKYNEYSHALVTNPAIYIAEVLLLLALLVHMGLAINLWFEGRRAKGQRNLKSPGEKGATFASKTMVFTGLLIFVFLIIHLKTFKFGTYYEITYGNVTMRDLHKLVVEEFQNVYYVGFYLFALVMLLLHLSHGFSAVFQSLGVASSINPSLRKMAWTLAILVVAGFASQPLYCLFALRG